MAGLVPYRHHRQDSIIIQAIMRRIRPVKPEDMQNLGSMGLSALLEKCWALNPSDRPDIAEVASSLSVIYP